MRRIGRITVTLVTGALLSTGLGAGTALAAPVPAAPAVSAVPVKAVSLRATGDRILPGQRLARGQAIASTNGRYRFTLQSDGNAVVSASGRAVWSTKTAARKGTQLTLQKDGNLVLRTAAGTRVWSTATAGRGVVRLVLKNDGNLVLVTAKDKVVWSTGVPKPAKPANPGNTKNCSDFRTRAQAQAWFDTYYPYYGDVAKLDADKDKKACEDLP